MAKRNPVIDRALEIARLIEVARFDRWSGDEFRDKALDVESRLSVLPASRFHAELYAKPGPGGPLGALSPAARLMVEAGLHHSRHTLVAAMCNAKRWPHGRPASAR